MPQRYQHGHVKRKVKRRPRHLSKEDEHQSTDSTNAAEGSCLYCSGSPLDDGGGSQSVGLGVDLSLCMEHAGPTGHPEAPERLQRVWEAVCAAGFCHRCTLTGSRRATEDEILSVHDAAHWNHIKFMSECGERASSPDDTATPIGGGDMYYVPSSPDAAATSLGTALQLMESIMDASSPVTRGFALVRLPGHHACRSKAMGFCLLNNTAVCAKTLRLRYKLHRVMIVDFDVHHGNGIQDAVYKDPNYLYLSIHRYDQGKFYPGTGSARDVGTAAGKGYTVNIPLEAGYGDADIYACVRDIVVPATEAYGPDFILVAAGFDAGEGDPLGHCCVTPEGYRWLSRQLLRLAETYADGRIAFILEGGYNPDRLAKNVVQCVQALCDDADPVSSGRFFVERLPSVEQPGVIGQNENVPPPSVSQPSPIVDVRHDLFSQLGTTNRGPGAVLPLTICSKTTHRAICDVAAIHAVLPLGLPVPLPRPRRIPLDRWSPHIKKDDGSRRRIASGHIMSSTLKSTTTLLHRRSEDPILHIQEHQHRLRFFDEEESSNLLDRLGPVDSFPTVGGHDDQWLQSPATRPGYILKRTSPSEAAFYVWIATQGTSHEQPEFRPLTCSATKTVIDFLNALPPPPLNAPEGQCQTLLRYIPHCCAVAINSNCSTVRNCYVEMENLIRDLRTPCMMDMKVGLRMYGDDATEEKKQRMIDKAKNSTALEYGVKVTATRAWSVEHQLLVETSRTEANQFRTLDDLRRAIFDFVNAAAQQDRCPIAEAFKNQIQEIYDLFKQQTVAHFFSSSLLFLYDATPASGLQQTAHVRMIDFAHVTYIPGTPDIGYIKGLTTLLALLEDYLIETTEEEVSFLL